MTPSQSIAQIVIALPPRPTDGDLLLALITAEQAGYERGLGAASPARAAEERANIIREEQEIEAGPGPTAPPTDCGDEDDAHDWQSPHEVVGGVESNPGVWSLGGTVYSSLEVCACCGLYRRTRHNGEERNPDDPETEVSYEDADERSLAWVAEQAEEV